MNSLKMYLTQAIIKFEEANTTPSGKLQSSITNAGNSLIAIIKACAGVVSLLISSIAGIVLLVLCITTAWKSRNGNSDAWGDAMQLIATVAAILCFSASIMTMFFA